MVPRRDRRRNVGLAPEGVMVRPTTQGTYSTDADMTLYKVTFIHTGRQPIDRMVAALDFPRALRTADVLTVKHCDPAFGMRIGAISQQMDLAAIDVDGVAKSAACVRVYDLAKETP